MHAWYIDTITACKLHESTVTKSDKFSWVKQMPEFIEMVRLVKSCEDKCPKILHDIITSDLKQVKKSYTKGDASLISELRDIKKELSTELASLDKKARHVKAVLAARKLAKADSEP